jgi:hypothetical protein
VIPKEPNIVPSFALKQKTNEEGSPRNEGAAQKADGSHPQSTMENLMHILSKRRGESHFKIIEIIL